MGVRPGTRSFFGAQYGTASFSSGGKSFCFSRESLSILVSLWLYLFFPHILWILVVLLWEREQKFRGLILYSG